MEFSWSALWNITDETPDNCQMFLECNGMNLFLECLKVRGRSHVSVSLSRSLCGRVRQRTLALVRFSGISVNARKAVYAAFQTHPE